MKEIIEKLITAADQHGADSGEPDHTVGDLQDMLRAAWELLSTSQKRDFLMHDAVESVVECGACGEFEVDDLDDALVLGDSCA